MQMLFLEFILYLCTLNAAEAFCCGWYPEYFTRVIYTK